VKKSVGGSWVRDLDAKKGIFFLVPSQKGLG